MWGWIAVLYILFGLLFAAAMSEIRDEFNRYLPPRKGSSRELAEDMIGALACDGQPPAEPVWKTALYQCLIGLLWLAIWPLMVPVFYWDRRIRKHESVTGEMFEWLYGAGRLVCHQCEAEESVTALRHGLRSGHRNTETGFQCQSCWQFTTIENAKGWNDNYKCKCGGALSRDAIIRCPSCWSTEVNYLNESR